MNNKQELEARVATLRDKDSRIAELEGALDEIEDMACEWSEEPACGVIEAMASKALTKHGAKDET